MFAMMGDRFRAEGTVEHVRKDGLLIVHYNDDPPGAISVVHPSDVRPAVRR
jgi:hypothetical protein